MRTIRDQIRAQLADLKMPGSLEGLDSVLSRVDSGLGAAEAISAVLSSRESPSATTVASRRRCEAAGFRP